MKKYKIGFLIGKFYPYTRGHNFLIDTASKNCDKVYVLCCSLKRETIPGELRYLWMKRDWIDTNVTIIWVQDENPQFPEEDPLNFWDIWLKTFKNNLPENPDVVFSSELYGNEIANRMGIVHHMVDLDRTIVPISATKIRNNPFKHWNYIPDVVKPYYTKRIVVLGTESSGKTTLMKKMASIVDDSIMIEEYGRTFTETINPSPELPDFLKILEGQDKLITDNLKKGNKFMFCDTDAITTKVFAMMFFPDSYHTIENELDYAILKQKYDEYILMDINTPSVQDGNRIFLDKREYHLSLIIKELKKFSIPYTFLTGSFEEKENRLIKLINDNYLRI